jgi:hypothetical protein
MSALQVSSAVPHSANHSGIWPIGLSLLLQHFKGTLEMVWANVNRVYIR